MTVLIDQLLHEAVRSDDDLEAGLTAGLGRATEAEMNIATGALPCRDSDCSQDADDGNDDHEFDERESLCFASVQSVRHSD